MKRILCSLLVATLPFGSVLADAPKEKNAKVTPVYQVIEYRDQPTRNVSCWHFSDVSGQANDVGSSR